MTNIRSSTNYLSLLNGLRQREDLLRIFIFTLVTIFVWIGSEIYLSQKKTDIPEDFQSYIQPLNPAINRAALDDIGKRRGFTKEELNDFNVTTPQIIPETIPTSAPASPSAQPTVLPVLSPTPSSL